MNEPLKNGRHETFAHLVAGGKDASLAYKEAGYSARGNVAETNACRLLRNAQIGTPSPVKQRIDYLISESRAESKLVATKTREEKLARLEEIAWDKTVKPSDTIAAIRAHNEMTGDNAPTKVITEDGPNKLASARERALKISSPFNRLASKVLISTRWSCFLDDFFRVDTGRNCSKHSVNPALNIPRCNLRD